MPLSKWRLSAMVMGDHMFLADRILEGLENLLFFAVLISDQMFFSQGFLGNLTLKSVIPFLSGWLEC